MKYIVSTIFICILLTQQIFSQTLQWRNLSSIQPTGRYDDIFFISSSTGWTITYNRVYKTTNSGDSWSLYFLQLSNRSLGFFDSQNGIIGTLDSVTPLVRTTNGGVNWNLVTNYSSMKPRGICGISIVNDSTAYACGTYYSTGRAYRTTNKGESWTLVFNDTSLARSLVDCYFWSQDSGMIAGGYNTSNIYSGSAVILTTTNGGVTWQRVFLSSRIGEWCWKIFFKSKNFGVVSIERPANLGLSYFVKTTNRGLNWTEIPFMTFDQEGIGFINENTGWIGGWGSSSNTSTHETTDGGLTWKAVSWGRFLNRIRFINDTLAFASGSYVSKYSRTVVGITRLSSEIPDKFLLSQNYPNPFNPITLIEFDIAKQGATGGPVKVNLTVYDQLGRIVRELINENLTPGSYQASFDAGYFPSGIYFYKIEAGQHTETKRMILLK